MGSDCCGAVRCSRRPPALSLAIGIGASFRADWNAVSPDYFKTLNMPLVSGRGFTEQDAAAAPGAIIINEAMAATTAMALEQFTALSLIPQRIAGAVAASLGVIVLLLAAIGGAAPRTRGATRKLPAGTARRARRSYARAARRVIRYHKTLTASGEIPALRPSSAVSTFSPQPP